MKPFILLIILCIAQIVFAPARSVRYRNVNSVAAAFFVWIAQIAIDLLVSFLYPFMYGFEENFYYVIMIQAIVMAVVKISAAKKDAKVRYGIPMRYKTGWRLSFIAGFYDFNVNTPIVYTKTSTIHVGSVSLCAAFVLSGAFLVQSYVYDMAGNTLLLPYCSAGLVSMLVEFGMFCMGESLWKKLLTQYKRRCGCKTRRQLAGIRYASSDDYKFIFMKNFVSEPLHIIRATMFRWKKERVQNSVRYYNFEDGSRQNYKLEEYNAALEDFLRLNSLVPNPLYITAYNLIDRNQNVLLKTPSYVDFEPYFTSMIKVKVAKTQTIVLIVSSEEKKATTISKIHNAFEEYFGFEEIPVICTINECVRIEQEKRAALNKQASNEERFSHFKNITSIEVDKAERESMPPVKSADIIVAAPEDICDPDNVDSVRSMVNNLGLIIYYDFSDSVQEEALFAKIVHSVLDCDDKISTLYMTDGFFDLDQVVDNFFSRRNIYEIAVPRQPSEKSYVMGWKAENISEIQSRTDPDSSRNIGNHIPILYDATSHTENDLMIVEDEYDAYLENCQNFSTDPIAGRFDFHVGWSDVVGGRSVVCSVSDTYNNVAHTYLAMRGIGSESEYINIVCRPYLLRGYLMYHLRHFTIRHGVLSSYSPGVIKTPRAVSYEAVIKAFVVGCSPEQLSQYVVKASLSCGNEPEEMLAALVECANGGEVKNLGIKKDMRGKYYIDELTYRDVTAKSGMIDKIEFVNNRQVYVRNKREYPYLIPHQKIVLNGVKYTVEKIEGDRVELTDSNKREPVFVTRPVRSCEINVSSVEHYGNIIQNVSNTALTFRRLVCDVGINVYGNITFRDCYHPFCEDARYDYQIASDTHHSSYTDVNVFTIKISSPDVNASNRDRLAHLMALLLNEMLPTFFPRNSERIIIGCNGWAISSDIENASVTTRNIVAQMNVSDPEPALENEICLYILEDSPIETGLVNVFWQDEEIRYMLRVMEDYLYYQEMINRAERKEIFADAYIPDLHALRKILLRLINETAEFYDADGNRQVDYFNKIRDTRNKYNRLEISNDFNISCDFCGREIKRISAESPGYHFYSYSGMISCMDCYNSAVCAEKDSQADVQGYQLIINNWFAKKYGSSVHSSFYNYLEDAERVEEIAVERTSAQNRYITTDDADRDGIFGLSYSPDLPDLNLIAVPNREYIPGTFAEASADGSGNPQVRFKAGISSADELEDIIRSSYLAYNSDYGNADIPFILIRNGLRYPEYMGVLCHEMTHKWQDENLDPAKLRANTPMGATDEFGKSVNLSLYRTEGHAEWERIRYMKENGARALARSEEAQLMHRADSYGFGYRWMRNMMKVGHDDMNIPAVRTPGFISKRNWYQLTGNSFGLMRLYFGVAKPEAESTGDAKTPSDAASEPGSTSETEAPAGTSES